MNFNILSFLKVGSKEDRAKDREQGKNYTNQMEAKESVLSSIKVRDKLKVWDYDPDLETILIQEKSSANSN